MGHWGRGGGGGVVGGGEWNGSIASFPYGN